MLRWLMACLALGTFPVFAEGALKVCADPSNLPLSNEKGEGYENKIAVALAHDLNRTVEYTFFPQRMGFVRNTLRSRDETTHEFKCDVIIGVPKGYEVTATTEPYLHSTYALIVSPHGEFAALQTADDLLKLPPAQLAKIKIGVFAKSPGNDWLLKNKLQEQQVSYTNQNGDMEESPARTIERDLKTGKIDVGILWGPFAGMLAKNHMADKWRVVPFSPDTAIKFDYEISMGLRQGEPDLKKTLDGWIASHGEAIAGIMKSYQIPVVDTTGHVQM